MITPGWFHQIGVITKKKNLHEAAVTSPRLCRAAHWNWSAARGMAQIFLVILCQIFSKLRSAMMMLSATHVPGQMTDCWLPVLMLPTVVQHRRDQADRANIGRDQQRPSSGWLLPRSASYTTWTPCDRTAPYIHNVHGVRKIFKQKKVFHFQTSFTQKTLFKL